MPKRQQAHFRKKLQRAYEKPTYEEAKAELSVIGKELKLVSESAVASLEEGLEETLTLHRLGLYEELGITFKTTNCIESILSQVGLRIDNGLLPSFCQNFEPFAAEAREPHTATPRLLKSQQVSGKDWIRRIDLPIPVVPAVLDQILRRLHGMLELFSLIRLWKLGFAPELGTFPLFQTHFPSLCDASGGIQNLDGNQMTLGVVVEGLHTVCFHRCRRQFPENNAEVVGAAVIATSSSSRT